MTTENSKKINQRTIEILHSPNPTAVTGAIEEIRERGNTAYLPVLFELLHSTNDDRVKRSITGLLAELKHREAIPMLMEAIQNKQYANELRSIVSACWENGLDYSEYLPVFVDLVIEKEFVVAFEAYTVITNMTGKISNAIQEKESRKIKEALRNSDSNKNDLLQDLLDFLPELEEGIEPGF
ncbi:MAG: HEAT repeat domain-containing protein [Mangrovibacterium sp.]|jgi:hypothetical protein